MSEYLCRITASVDSVNNATDTWRSPTCHPLIKAITVVRIDAKRWKKHVEEDRTGRVPWMPSEENPLFRRKQRDGTSVANRSGTAISPGGRRMRKNDKIWRTNLKQIFYFLVLVRVNIVSRNSSFFSIEEKQKSKDSRLLSFSFFTFSIFWEISQCALNPIQLNL